MHHMEQINLYHRYFVLIIEHNGFILKVTKISWQIINQYLKLNKRFHMYIFHNKQGINNHLAQSNTGFPHTNKINPIFNVHYSVAVC